MIFNDFQHLGPHIWQLIFNDFQYPGPHIWPLISLIFNYFLWFSIIFTDFQCPWTHIWPICAPYMAQMKGHGSHILPMCGPYMAPIWSKNHCGWDFFHLQPSPAPAPGMPWPAPSHQPPPSIKEIDKCDVAYHVPPSGGGCYYCRGVDSYEERRIQHFFRPKKVGPYCLGVY